MEVWKMIFLFSWVILRFHVKFQGCMGCVFFSDPPKTLVISLDSQPGYRLDFYTSANLRHGDLVDAPCGRKLGIYNPENQHDIGQSHTITIFKRRYIFNWLFVHCHVSFRKFLMIGRNYWALKQLNNLSWEFFRRKKFLEQNLSNLCFKRLIKHKNMRGLPWIHTTVGSCCTWFNSIDYGQVKVIIFPKVR